MPRLRSFLFFGAISLIGFPSFASAGFGILPELNVGAGSAQVGYAGDTKGQAIDLWARARWLYAFSSTPTPYGSFLELGASGHLQTLKAVSGPDPEFKEYQAFLNWHSARARVTGTFGVSLGAGISTHFWNTADRNYEVLWPTSLSAFPEFAFALGQKSELVLRAGAGVIFSGFSILNTSQSNRLFGELVYRSYFSSSSSWNARLGFDSTRVDSSGGIAEFQSINASLGVGF